MEYHEIGERFEYDGVMLEVVKRDNCNDCFFRGRVECGVMSPMRCSSDVRNDDTSIIYKLVEQCKTKDMEQKAEFMVAGMDIAFATQVTNPQSDEEIYGSLLDKLFTTYKAKDADYGSAFAEMFYRPQG